METLKKWFEGFTKGKREIESEEEIKRFRDFLKEAEEFCSIAHTRNRLIENHMAILLKEDK